MPTTEPRKILYIDLDNTLVDFPSGIERLTPDAKAVYEGHFDDAPGIFALMDPLPGAVEAFHELAQHFDTYILSTAPWNNASAWHDKLLWVQKHFGADEGTPAWKRLILSHHKNLNRGDFLVDDRPHNGAEHFEGEWLYFGEAQDAVYRSWPAVTEYLLPKAGGPTLAAAVAIARTAHAGQVDKLGVDYIEHPLAVMRGVTGDAEKIVAILHDVVEDTTVTLDDLASRGFSPRIIEAVDALSKRPGEPLEQSMRRVLASPLAVTVKRADLAHNADPQRFSQLPLDTQTKLCSKYEASAGYLGTTLHEILTAAAATR